MSEGDSFPLAANCIDEDIGLENKFHEFVSEKPNWLKIGDTAKQFDEHPFESQNSDIKKSRLLLALPFATVDL